MASNLVVNVADEPKPKATSVQHGSLPPKPHEVLEDDEDHIKPISKIYDITADSAPFTLFRSPSNIPTVIASSEFRNALGLDSVQDKNFYTYNAVQCWIQAINLSRTSKDKIVLEFLEEVKQKANEWLEWAQHNIMNGEGLPPRINRDTGEAYYWMTYIQVLQKLVSKNRISTHKRMLFHGQIGCVWLRDDELWIQGVQEVDEGSGRIFTLNMTIEQMACGYFKLEKVD